MILTFTDGREDISLWTPRSGASVRIETGNEFQPDHVVLTGNGTGNVVCWPALAENYVRNEAIPVGQVGAFELRDNTPEQIDAWVLKCCKFAAKYFGAATASQYDVTYSRG